MSPRPVLELVDVVLVTGSTGREDVLLRGADLVVAAGEHVLVTGLDAAARRSLGALLRRRVTPRYGSVTVEGSVTVVDAGEGPDAAAPLPGAGTVVVLGGPGWAAHPPAGYRAVRVAGGRLLDAAVSR